MIESGGAQPIQPVGARPIAVSKKAGNDSGFVVLMVILSFIFVFLFCAAAYKITTQEDRIKSLEADKLSLARRDFGLSSPEYMQLKFLTAKQAATIRNQANTIRDLESKLALAPDKSNNVESHRSSPTRVVGNESIDVLPLPGLNRIDPNTLNVYLHEVKQRIHSNWYPPHVDHGPIDALITISSYGKAASCYLSSGSGVKEVDESVIEAVQGAVPYVPTPPEFESDSINLQVIIGVGTGPKTTKEPIEPLPTKPIFQHYRPVDGGSSGGSGNG